MACALPAEQGVPLSRWSATELAREAVVRGIVEQISGVTVWRWLSEDAIKPCRDLIVAQPVGRQEHHPSARHMPIRRRIRTRQRLQDGALICGQLDSIGTAPRHQNPHTTGTGCHRRYAPSRTF